MRKKLLQALIVLFVCTSCNNISERKIPAVKVSKEGKRLSITHTAATRIKTVGILLYDGYAVLDAMGPYHVLSEMTGVDVFFVGRRAGMITTGNGMKVLCDTSIDLVKQLDILVIPGGLQETYNATRDTTLLAWIKAIDKNSTYTASVCTGAWILGATGLLKRKPATTHWYGKAILCGEFGANLQNKRYVKSGKYWTSAGVTAGMDMSLAIVNEIMGETYTKAAMLDLEYDPQPPLTGGSVQHTDKEIVETVRSIYDGSMQKILHPETVLKNLKFANSKDFVCGMPVTSGVADTVHYGGKVYAFCSPVCRNSFKKDPASYIATE